MNKFLENIKDLNSVMLFDAPQTGKTKRSLELCIYREYKRVIVVIPKNINTQWVKDVGELLPTHDIFDLTIDKNKKKSVYENIQASKQCFVLTTYHFFAHNFYEISKPIFDCFIIDEAHNHKSNKKSSIAGRIRINSNGIKNKIALTGTPASNNLLDLWSILAIMFPREHGNFFHFRNTYFLPDGMMKLKGKNITTSWKTNEYSFQALKDFIAKNSTQISIGDVYENSTTKVRSFINIEMPDYKKEELENIKKTYKIEYKTWTNDLLTTTNLSHLMAMEEYFNGCDIYGNENIKFNKLIEYVEANYKDKKIIIYNNWSSHNEFMSQNRKENWYYQIGNLKEVEEFKKVKSGILFMNPTLAEGQRLSDVDALIFYTIPYSPAKLKQAEDRVVKEIKKGEEVIKEICYVIYENSNDKHIYELVKEKNINLNKLSNQKKYFD